MTPNASWDQCKVLAEKHRRLAAIRMALQDFGIATTTTLVGWCFLNLMDRIMFGLAVAHG